MNYLVTKKQGDSRKGICGLIIPDGFMVVVEYLPETHQQLMNIKNLPNRNYELQKTDLPVGIYAPNGRRVTKDSVYNWYLYQRELVYVDEEPVGEEAIPAPDRSVRPPDLSLRPDYVSLDDIGEAESPEVKRAREIIERAQAAGKTQEAAPKRMAEDRSVPLEDDVETLKAQGGTDELTMLRSALDARGIEWNKSMNRKTLRNLLDDAAA